MKNHVCVPKFSSEKGILYHSYHGRGAFRSAFAGSDEVTPRLPVCCAVRRSNGVYTLTVSFTETLANPVFGPIQQSRDFVSSGSILPTYS